MIAPKIPLKISLKVPMGIALAVLSLCPLRISLRVSTDILTQISSGTVAWILQALSTGIFFSEIAVINPLRIPRGFPVNFPGGFYHKLQNKSQQYSWIRAFLK